MKALVLSGGGAKGSYQIGVMKALKELKYEPEIVTGTSIGSINGALYVQGGYKVVNNFWNSMKITDLLKFENNEIFKIDNKKLELKANLLYEIVKNNGVDYKPFLKKIEKVINEDKIRKSKKDFGLITVNLTSLKPMILYKKDIERGQMANYIMASCACFPTMKMQKIGGDLYIDGAYYDNMPIEQAVKKGATEVVAVDLKAIGMYRKPKNKNVKVINISPKKSLGDFVLFDKESIEKNSKLGYIDTMKAFGKYSGNKYSFTKVTIDEIIKLYDKSIREELTLLINNETNEKRGIVKTMNTLGFKDAYKKIKDEYAKQKGTVIIEILETLLSELDADEYETYTLFKIKRLINQNYKPEIIKTIENEIEKLFKMDKKKEDNNVKVQKIINKISNEHITNYILKLLEEESSERNKVELKLFSTFAKRNLLAAILIKAIKVKK